MQTFLGILNQEIVDLVILNPLVTVERRKAENCR